MLRMRVVRAFRIEVRRTEEACPWWTTFQQPEKSMGWRQATTVQLQSIAESDALPVDPRENLNQNRHMSNRGRR